MWERTCTLKSLYCRYEKWFFMRLTNLPKVRHINKWQRNYLNSGFSTAYFQVHIQFMLFGWCNVYFFLWNFLNQCDFESLKTESLEINMIPLIKFFFSLLHKCYSLNKTFDMSFGHIFKFRKYTKLKIVNYYFELA